MTFEPRAAVVTGASRGIGRATALALARRGIQVALASEIEDSGGRALVVPCDVSQAPDVSALATESSRELGTVDLLVNNAGVVARSRIVDTTEDDWDSVLDVNLKGAFLCTRAFLPGMIEHGRGRVVNVASISGSLGTPQLSAYCASKWGLLGLTKAAAEEVKADGVQVFAVSPGSVDTDMLREGLPGAEPDMTPEDVANVIVYLSCFAPDAMTGAAVDVFG